jgi:hypothetical protein
MMTKDKIGEIINPEFPYVYAPTNAPTKLVFEDNSIKVGYFQHTEQSKELESKNQYTFIEFGEKAQQYKATNDFKYITIVEGDKLKNVEYPSYGEALGDKLRRLKELTEQKKEPDWEEYKKNWVTAIGELQHTLMYKWLLEYEEAGSMVFSLIPTKRIDPKIGEYLTSYLEITFLNNKSIVLEPITGMTTDYDGKLEFYMRGNVYKNVSILRKIIDGNKYEWIIAKSYNQRDHYKLNKEEIDKLIFEWLQ